MRVQPPRSAEQLWSGAGLGCGQRPIVRLTGTGMIPSRIDEAGALTADYGPYSLPDVRC